MGSKNVKAVVVKSGTDMPKPADPETFQEGYQQAMEVIRESDVTAPNEGGLSMYGTNVLMNATEEMDGSPAKNAKYTSTEAYRDAEGGVDTDAESASPARTSARTSSSTSRRVTPVRSRVRKRSRSTSPTRAMR